MRISKLEHQLSYDDGMPSPRTFSRALGLACALATLADGVRAQSIGDPDEPAPVRISYSAPPDCPSADDFLRFVQSELEGESVVIADTTQSVVVVIVSSEDDGAKGNLRIQSNSAPPETRELVGATCEEVVRAAALVTALVVEARAAPVPENEPPASAPPARPPTPTVEQPRREPLEVMDEAQGSGVATGARFRADTPKGPTILLGGEAFFEVLGEGESWAASVSIGAMRGASVNVSGAEATFSWWGGRVTGCFPGLDLGQTVWMAPCALAEGGRIIAEGVADGGSRSVHDWAGGFGAAGRVGFRFGSLRADLEGGGIISLNPDDRYVFSRTDGTELSVHSVPWVGAFGTLGASWRF